MTHTSLLAGLAMIALVAAAAVPAAAPAQSAPQARKGAPLPAVSVLDAQPGFNGIGPLRFGMTAAQARAAWGLPLHGEAPEQDPQACYYLSPQAGSHGLLFMVEGGRFVRVDVTTPAKTAPGGGRVGMPTRELEKLYAGRLATARGKYDAGSTVLTVMAPGGAPAKLVFTTSAAGVVTAWRIGTPPQVDYVEGCG